MSANTISTYEQSAIDFLQSTNTSFKAEYIGFDYHFQDDKHKRNIFKCTLSNSLHSYSFKFGASLKDSLENSNDVIYEDSIEFFSGIKFEGLKDQYLSIRKTLKIADIKHVNDSAKPNWLSLFSAGEIEGIYKKWFEANTIKSKHYGAYPTKPKFTLEQFKDNIIRTIIRKSVELSSKNWGVGVQANEIIYPTAYDVLTCLEKYEHADFDDFCDNYGYDNDSRKAKKLYLAVKKEYNNISRLFSAEEIERLQEIQ